MSQYNKIFFQAATTGVNGWHDFVTKCNDKGIPISAAVTDSMSLLYDLQTVGQAKGVKNRGNFRPTGTLTPHEMRQAGVHWEDGWGAYPLDQPVLQTQKNSSRYSKRDSAEKVYETAGQQHVKAVLSRLPQELDKSMMSVCSWNEVRDYRGWQEETKTGSVDPQETVVGYTGWADVIGRQAYWIGTELIRRKKKGEKWFRWAPFAFAGGNPEEGVWEEPGMLDYLRLAGEHPDVLGIALHEYCLSLDVEDGFANKTKIGRFEKLFAVCDKHNIPRPWVEITEWGWKQNDIPEKAKAMAQIKKIAAYYAQFPQVKLAAIWTLSGDGKWGGVNKKVAALAPDLYEFTLGTTYADPAPHITKPSKPQTTKPTKQSHATTGHTTQQTGQSTATLAGIDVSSAVLTADLLHSHKPAFVFQRAIAWEGTGGVYRPVADGHFAQNIATCATSNIPVGAYMVLYPNEMTNAAKLFAEQIQDVQSQTGGQPLRGAVGIVVSTLTPDDVKTFLKALAAQLPSDHPKPILLTRASNWQTIMGTDSAWASDYPLWLIDQDSEAPDVPAPWSAWTMWQHGNTTWGNTAVDLNKMAADQLAALKLPTIARKSQPQKPKHPTTPFGQEYDLAPYFFPVSGPYGPKIILHNKNNDGQPVQLYREGDISYLLKGNEHEKRRITNSKIYLELDTSEGNGRFYTIKAPDTGWIPTKMAVGQRYSRTEWVTHYKIADCKPVAPGQKIDNSYMRFAAIHKTWQSPKNPQISFPNVIELVWETKNAQGGYDTQEVYFYAVGVGLVGWIATRGDVGWIVEKTHGQTPLKLEKVHCPKV